MENDTLKRTAERAWQLVTRRQDFELKYVLRGAQSRLAPKQQLDTDVVFVTPPGNESWILHAICQEIDTYLDRESIHVASDTVNPPRAQVYFFSHYLFFHTWLLKHPQVARAKNVVWYTHPKGLRISTDERAYLLNQAHHTFSSCEMFTQELILQGVAADRVSTAIPGADPQMFRPHQRNGKGAVGFCSTYVERKNPERIVDIVKACPHRRFILLGRNWRKYPRFAELNSAPNFEYKELSYKEYPSFYDSLEVLVSPSRLEGGPIPLLEAMMSNVVPVASRTGFAEDIITHGENGFIFDVDAPTDEIASLIDQAFAATGDIRSTVQRYSWQRYSQHIQTKFEFASAHKRSA